jgi:hypothetical protein
MYLQNKILISEYYLKYSNYIYQNSKLTVMRLHNNFMINMFIYIDVIFFVELNDKIL